MPPSAIVCVPVPKLPIFNPIMLFQVEPAPVNVTVPSPPGKLLSIPEDAATVPSAWIVSIPVPFTPMVRVRANAPGLTTTTEFGVTVLMFPSVVCRGKPASQLPLRNQLEENCPTQLVWACVELADAMNSAIVAGNLELAMHRGAKTIRAAECTCKAAAAHLPRRRRRSPSHSDLCDALSPSLSSSGKMRGLPYAGYPVSATYWRLRFSVALERIEVTDCGLA
jgi:hypothetical protein